MLNLYLRIYILLLTLFPCLFASLDSDAWRITERGRSVHNNTATTTTTTTADVHPMFAGGSPPDEAGGIYSDIPDLPSDLPPDIPPPDSPVRMTHKSYIIVYAYF